MPNEPATTGKRKREPSHRMPLDECQTRLATIWVVGLGVCLLVLMGQTVGGRYQADYRKAWEWWIPQIFPTLGVIVGGVAYGVGQRTRNMEVAAAPYRLAMSLSALYLVTLVATLVLVGFVPSPGAHGQSASAAPPGDNTWLDVSKVWFTPFNGLVTALLGAFFASSQPAKPVRPGEGTAGADAKPAPGVEGYVPRQWKGGQPEEGLA